MLVQIESVLGLPIIGGLIRVLLLLLVLLILRRLLSLVFRQIEQRLEV